VDDTRVDLARLGAQLLDDAAGQATQRAARTLPHPVDGLRQTVMALLDGQQLAEHESPGAASLLVLRGKVQLVAGEESVTLRELESCPIPDRRHSLRAEEDSVVLLTVALPAP
jgi:quercetin dioxygenase-like cupin family protein